MKSKDAYYFPHDSNARNDYKLLRLRAKFGWEGYGIYFAIIEILREQSDYKLGKESSEAIATAIGKPFEWVQDFVNNLIHLGLLCMEDGGWLYSESLISRMQQYEDRKYMLSEAGKKGAKIKQEKRLSWLKQPLSIKENKIKENKIKENKIIPTLVEFNSYCKTLSIYHESLDFQIEAKYNAWVENDWKDGNNKPIKNWKTKLQNTIPYFKRAYNGTNSKSNGASPDFLRELVTNRASKE